MDAYFGGINSGDYAAAHAVFSPRLQGQASEQSFAAGDSSSYDFGQTILDANPIAPGTVLVGLAFTSIQASAQGPNGDTCDNWTLSYTMIQAADSSWRIDRTRAYNGRPEHTAC